MSDPAWGDQTLIADSSARARAAHPSVRHAWANAMRARRIAICSLVTLELSHVARDVDGVIATESALARLRDVPVTVSVQRAAIGAIRDLAATGPLHHRVPLPDVLIAAAAQEAGLASAL